MMRLMLLLICSLLTGCLGPKVNNCIFDFNVIDRAIKNAPDPITKESVVALLQQSKPWYCVPPGVKDDSEDFMRAMKTGDHGYDAHDWGILMRWIVDHTK